MKQKHPAVAALVAKNGLKHRLAAVSEVTAPLKCLGLKGLPIALPIGLAAVLLAGGAYADQQLGYLNPYVGVDVGYDDNVFRADDRGDLPAGVENRSSAFQRLSVGAEARTYIGQQQLNLSAEFWRERYDNIDDLDHNGVQAKAEWKIKAGPNWQGQVYYDFSRMLREFEFLAEPDTGVREIGTFGASISRSLGYRHQVEIFANHSDISIERDRSVEVDRDVLGGRYALALTAGNRVGVEIRYLNREGDTQPLNNLSFNGDFEQTTVGPFLQWAVGAKSKLDVFIGYADRNPDDDFADDYQGLVADVEFNWQISTKTDFVVSAWRKVSNLSDEISNYALVQGLSLEPTWRASEKLSLSAFGSYENRDFRGGIGRDDDVFKAGAEVSWLLPRSLSLTLRYEHGDRDSTRALTDFDFNTTSLEVLFKP